MEPVDKTTSEHYVWGNGCDGWHLVRTPELSVLEERMSAGTAEQRHRHTRARQFFYVTAGELTMEVEGTVHTLTAAQGLEIAPGEAHQAANRSGEDVRFVVVSSPPSHGDRVTATAAA